MMMRPLSWHDVNVSRMLETSERNEREALLALERALLLRLTAQQYAKKIEKARNAGKKEMKVE